MATDIDMLIDLGLDLSDSDLDEDPPEPAESRRDDLESDSSGECSSSDEDMEDPHGEDGPEPILDAARPAVRPSRPEDPGVPSTQTPRPTERQGPNDPQPAPHSVWSRLGARRPSCSPEQHGGKVARLQPPPTKAQPARGGRRGRRRGRGRGGPGAADGLSDPRRRAPRTNRNPGGPRPGAGWTDGPGAPHWRGVARK